MFDVADCDLKFHSMSRYSMMIEISPKARKCTGALALLAILTLSGCASSGAQKAANSASNLFKQDGYERLLERQRASEAPELTSADKLPAMTDAERERQGDSYFEQGRPEMAFLQYTKVLKNHPDNANLLCKRGMVFLSRGLMEDAAKDFEAALAKDPSLGLAHQGMGEVLFKKRKYAEAKQQFQQAVNGDPNLWMSLNFMGLIEDYELRPETAVEYYKSAIAIKPNEASLYNNLGVSYSMTGQSEEAVDAFSRGLRIAPKDPKIGNNMGMVLCKLGRYAEALEAFEKSTDEAQAYNNLGCFFMQENQYDKAMQAFEKAIKLRSGDYPQANDNLKRTEAALHAAMTTGGSKKQ